MMPLPSEDPIEFELDEPPTVPHRSSTGRAIKGPIIRAFHEQAQAEKKAHQALDDLVKLLRQHNFEVPEYVKELTKRETGKTRVAPLRKDSGYTRVDLPPEKLK